MARKLGLILAVLGLPSVFLVTAASGVAPAQRVDPGTILPGTVTCGRTGGVWLGTVHFDPPLESGGTADFENIKVSADLGGTSRCTTSVPSANGISGSITMHLYDFSSPGDANSCAFIFSGSPLPPPVGRHTKVVLRWTDPEAPSTRVVPMPPFSVVGSATMTSITVTGGTAGGSFSNTDLIPSATLSDGGWPATIAARCAAPGGLRSLTLGTSTGSW